MKKITGLKIAAVEELENGLKVELEDGTLLVGNIFVIETEDAPATAAPAPKKEEAKPAAKGPKIPTFDELQDMDLDELKDVIDDHDLEIKTKGKDEEDLIEAIVEALEIEKPAKKGKKEEAKPAKKEVDVDDLVWSDIEDMDEDEVKDLIKQEKIDVDPEDFDDDLEGLQKAVAKELGIKVPKK